MGSARGGYESTVYKYETRHDQKAYEKASQDWRDNGRIGNYPGYETYNEVYCLDGVSGDTAVTCHPHDYPSEKDLTAGLGARRLSAQEVADAPMTRLNSAFSAREIQSKVFRELGYNGPVGGGEARALKNLFTEMGQSDLVRHGFFRVKKTVKRAPSSYQVRRAQWSNQPAPGPREVSVEVLQECYVFKSPIPSVPFDKFVKLARMYKSDKGGLRKAVQAVLANPEAHKEVETLDCIDLLGKMVGMD